MAEKPDGRNSGRAGVAAVGESRIGGRVGEWERLKIGSSRKEEVAEEAGITEKESGEWQERSWRK